MNPTVMTQINNISATHPNPSKAKRQIRMRLALEDVLSIEKKQREQRMMIKVKYQKMINLLMRRKL